MEPGNYASELLMAFAQGLLRGLLRYWGYLLGFLVLAVLFTVAEARLKAPKGGRRWSPTPTSRMPSVMPYRLRDDFITAAELDFYRVLG